MGKRTIIGTLIGLSLFGGSMTGLYAEDKPAATTGNKQVVIPTIAIIPFASRLTGSSNEGIGNSIADLLTGQMSESGEFDLADRSEIDKALGELKLSASGLVAPESQLKIGQLIGAKIIITGSVFKSSDKNYIVAKIIGVETTRVLGASVSGTGAPLDLVPELKAKIAEKIKAQSATLLPPILNTPSVLEELKKEIGSGNGQKVYVKINERTALNIDPAVEIEFKKLLLGLGFDVVDTTVSADFRITGEGLAENSGEFKGFYSATARVEISLTAKNGQLIAADRQVETVAGPAENIACKDALMQSALVLARRIIPQMK